MKKTKILWFLGNVDPKEVPSMVDDNNKLLKKLKKDKYFQEPIKVGKCRHLRVEENLQGGRFDRCLDCGKTWGA